MSDLRRAVSPGAVGVASDQPLELRIAGRSLTLQPGLTYLIGSSETAHIQLAGPGIEPEHFSLRDSVMRVSQSRSATRLNGREVTTAQSPQLRDGDVIGLGTHSISVHTSHTPGVESQHAIVGASQGQQTRSLPDKVAEAHTRKENSGMAYGQSLNDKELDRTLPPLMQQTQQQPTAQPLRLEQQSQPLQQTYQPRDNNDERRHILSASADQSYLAQQQQPQLQSNSALAQEQLQTRPPEHNQLVQPGETGTMSNGLEVQAGTRPILMREPDTQQQQAFQGHGATGPSVARLHYHHNKPQQQSHVAGSALPVALPVATLENNTNAPAAAKVTMINPQEQQQDTTAELDQQSTLSSGQNRFQQMSLNSASSAQSSDVGSSGLAPVFTNTELTSILVDMLDLSGSSMNESSRALVPHWLSLFPASSRQNMGSKQIKVWIRKAIEERDARLRGGPSTETVPSAADAAASLTNSQAKNPAQLIESDLALALLALQAESQGSAQSLSSRVSQSRLSDYNLLSLLSDYAEMGGWTLRGSWESAARYMLDAQHTHTSRRDSMGSLDVRTWLRAAAEDRLKMDRCTGTAAQAGAGDSKTITPLQLVHGLVASNQHPI